jgi:hypothetical protein
MSTKKYAQRYSKILPKLSFKPVLDYKKNFKGEIYEPLIKWDKLMKIFPWSVVFLIGGGLALGEKKTKYLR